MALIRAISAVEYGDKYIWYYQPLFRLREPGSGGVMETFCTRMLQAGTVDGGTNHHPAGISEYTNEIVFKQSLELYEEHGKLEIARINAATSKERVRKFKKWEKVQELERLEVENEGLQTRLDSRIEDRRVRARALKEAQESVDKIEEMNDELEALVLGAEEKQAKMRGWN
jgi:regulator of replication initiation timing